MSASRVAVNLKLDPSDKDWNKYALLPPVEKIIYIRKRIKEICNQHRGKRVIILMREYAVFNGPRDLFLWEHTKELFKREMLSLTKKNKNLTIFAGTVPVRRQGVSLKKAKKQLQSIAWVKFVEDQDYEKRLKKLEEVEVPKYKIELLLKGVKEGSPEFDKKIEEFKVEKIADLKYYLQFEKHQAELKEVEAKSPKKYDELTNTSYVFEGSRCYRYDKQVPYSETDPYISAAELATPTSERPILVGPQPEDKKAQPVAITKRSYRDVVYSPGTVKSKNPVITHRNPDGTTFKSGREICRDHGFGALKKHVGDEMLDLHVTMSASIDNRQENICGKHYIHVDRRYPTIYYVQGDAKEATIQLFEHNVLKNDLNMTEIKPVSIPVRSPKVLDAKKASTLSPKTIPLDAKVADEAVGKRTDTLPGVASTTKSVAPENLLAGLSKADKAELDEKEEAKSAAPAQVEEFLPSLSEEDNAELEKLIPSKPAALTEYFPTLSPDDLAEISKMNEEILKRSMESAFRDHKIELDSLSADILSPKVRVVDMTAEDKVEWSPKSDTSSVAGARMPKLSLKIEPENDSRFSPDQVQSGDVVVTSENFREALLDDSDDEYFMNKGIDLNSPSLVQQEETHRSMSPMSVADYHRRLDKVTKAFDLMMGEMENKDHNNEGDDLDLAGDPSWARTRSVSKDARALTVDTNAATMGEFESLGTGDDEQDEKEFHTPIAIYTPESQPDETLNAPKAASSRFFRFPVTNILNDKKFEDKKEDKRTPKKVPPRMCVTP
jgi:hypothetical protein